MADKGFAIRCPHCREWSVWRNLHPEQVALQSERELERLLQELEAAGLGADEDGFSHPKLFRCRSPRWVCPASFEAFVCRSKDDAFKFSQSVEAWSLKRDFRLYKADCETRWEGEYYGILFSTERVPRLQGMELEPLIGRDLLSRLIVGMSAEIEGPVTVFAANIFEPDDSGPKIYWMPIEAYSPTGEVLIPPRLNVFCRTCRKIVMYQLLTEFRGNGYSVSNCPLGGYGQNGMCAGKEAACLREPQDWNHCPAFIKRREACPCGSSDRELITEVKEKWRRGEAMKKGVRQRCRAGLLEIGFRVVVHDHLVGVVMTGQVFFAPEEIRDVESFVKEWDILKGHEEDLEQAKEQLICEEQEARTKDRTTSFLTTEAELEERVSLLVDNIQRITEMANSRYRDFRGKAESVFGEEILGRIENSKARDTFFTNDLVKVLERMREFWAFQGAYLGAYSFKTEELSMIACARRDEYKCFGIPGKKMAVLNMQHRQEQPCPFIHIRAESPPRDSRLVDLLPIMEAAIDAPGLRVSKGDCLCGALIPSSDNVYAFVFAVRDEGAVSALERRVPGGVSDLCQDAILETCTRVILAFGDVLYRNANELAWGEFSALASHRIGNEVHCVGVLLDSLRKQLMADSTWAQRWRKKLAIMGQCIKRAKKMLTEQAMLTAQIRPRLKRTSLESLVWRGATGVLPDTAKLTFERSVAGKEILADQDLMGQAIRELCVNAVRAGGDSVELTVGATEDASNVHISFRDNGPGIPGNEREELFEPFRSSSGYGMGLGLSTVRHIIEAHGGSIRVAESEVGGNFIISLPVKGE